MKRYTQDPADKQDYEVALTNGTLTGATAAITPTTGVTLGSVYQTAESARVRVSGLTLGVTYLLTLHIIDVSGQEWDRSCEILCTTQ